MPYCPRCGNEVSEDARFCGACGSPISANEKTTTAKRASSHTSARITIAATIAVAIALVLCLAVVLVTRTGSDAANPGQDSTTPDQVADADVSASAKDSAPSVSKPSDAGTADAAANKGTAAESVTLEGDNWSLALPAYWTDKVTVKKESSDNGVSYSVYPLGQEEYPVVSVFETDDPKQEKSTFNIVTLADGTTADIVLPSGMAYRFSVPLGDGTYVAVQTAQAYAEVSTNRWKGLTQEQVDQMGDLQSQGTAQYSNDPTDKSIPVRCLRELALTLTVESKDDGTTTSSST